MKGLLSLLLADESTLTKVAGKMQIKSGGVAYAQLATLGVIAKIVSYTGDGNDNRTVAHGLGVTPNVVLTNTISAAEGNEFWITGFGANSKDLSSANVDTTAIKAVDATNITFGTGNGNTTSRAYIMLVLAIK